MSHVQISYEEERQAEQWAREESYKRHEALKKFRKNLNSLGDNQSYENIIFKFGDLCHDIQYDSSEFQDEAHDTFINLFKTLMKNNEITHIETLLNNKYLKYIVKENISEILRHTFTSDYFEQILIILNSNQKNSLISYLEPVQGLLRN